MVVVMLSDLTLSTSLSWFAQTFQQGASGSFAVQGEHFEDYADGISMCWVLTLGTSVSSVTFSFTDFQTEHDHDFVSIYNANDERKGELTTNMSHHHHQPATVAAAAATTVQHSPFAIH